MKIAAPLRAPDELEPLARAGAGEVFCGVLDLGARPDYFPNGRSQPSANLASFRELEQVAALGRARGVAVMFCANAPQGRVQTGWLKDDILRACAAGVSGIVLADHCLLPWAARQAPGLTLAMGTLSPALNRPTLDLLAGCGAKRVVLERLLTLAEIAGLTAHARGLGLKTEVLIATACVHINAFCHYHQLHARWEGDLQALTRGPYAPCRQPQQIEVWDAGRPLGARAAAAAQPWGFCALCSLPQLQEAGVAYIKVPGRENPIEERLRRVSMVRRCLLDREAGPRLHREFLGRDCSWQDCQHYEVYARRRGES
ncbi:MAG: U32 family peptidase [Elusimicrobia bacterium]|nr:U32 family peptidase [Elusimicrobiota bacterium]